MGCLFAIVFNLVFADSYQVGALDPGNASLTLWISFNGRLESKSAALLSAQANICF
jgi:hypothetical protein